MHERGPVSEVVAELGRRHREVPLASAEIIVGPTIDLSVAVAAYEHIVTGTDLSTVAITWTRTLDTLTCFSCGSEYEGEKVDPCPSCGGPGLVVDPAQDVVLGRAEVGV
jgi:Zn finger protein HypA/HybF involved in hydrogenase expression